MTTGPPFSQSPPPTGTTDPKTGCLGKRVLLGLLGAALGIGVVVLVVGGLGFLYLFSANETAPSAQERELLLDVEYLTEWFELTPEPDLERAIKNTYFDNSWELDYEYESDDLYLTYVIGYEPKMSDVMVVYTSTWGGLRIGVGLDGDASLAEDNESFSWGDASRFGWLIVDGDTRGNVFIARRGHYVVYWVLSGAYFEEAEDVRAFLTPYLDKVEPGDR